MPPDIMNCEPRYRTKFLSKTGISESGGVSLDMPTVMMQFYTKFMVKKLDALLALNHTADAKERLEIAITNHLVDGMNQDPPVLSQDEVRFLNDFKTALTKDVKLLDSIVLSQGTILGACYPRL